MKLFGSKNNKIRASEHPSLTEEIFGRFVDLPVPEKRATKKELEKQAYISQLADLQNAPIRLLEHAARILTPLNRRKMKADTRLALLNTIFSQTYPVISTWYRKCQSMDSSLPESIEYRRVISGGVLAIEQLLIGYKHLFQADYTTKSDAFDDVHSYLSLIGLRTLELIRIEQRLRALSYKKLTKHTWLDCNQVFFSMLLHNKVDKPHHLFAVLDSYDKIKKSIKEPGPKSTIRNVYVSIQLFGLLDVSAWPARLLHISDSYLEYLGAGITITPDNDLDLKTGRVITFLKNDRPPLFDRYENTPGPAIQIDTTAFYNALIKDHEEITEMKFISAFDPRKLSPPMQQLEDDDRLPVLEMMFDTLKHKTRQQKRHTVFDKEQLMVYFGKSEVIQLLKNINCSDVKISTNPHWWVIVNFSMGGMLISTDETTLNSPVRAGQLIAFFPENVDMKKT